MNCRELLIGGAALAAGESLGLAGAAEQVRSAGPARVAPRRLTASTGTGAARITDIMIEPHLPEHCEMSRDTRRAMFKGAQ